MTTEEQLRAEIKALKADLAAAEEDNETTCDELDDVRERLERVDVRANQAEGEAGDAFAAMSSLRRHVWRDDKPGATYCVQCGRTWPIHRHDCPFGDVD